MNFQFSPVATVRSCFKEKFGIPRQTGLVPEATGVIEFLPPFNRQEAVRGLEGFSHIWILFVFHGLSDRRKRTTVRPPRMGGNRRMGVFATRSGFRPNAIGLSVVELTYVEVGRRGPRLHVRGLDLLDGTPVLDIKPYLPYADRVADASGGYAASAPASDRPVFFSSRAKHFCRQYEAREGISLSALVSRLLSLDPRPGYTRKDEKSRLHGIRILDVNVRWKATADGFLVTDIDPAED